MYDIENGIREISFKVAGNETSDERLLICIPRRYADLFEGAEFEDMHHLSMALMHAGCADEARYYNRPWKVQEYEGDLMRTLGRK